MRIRRRLKSAKDLILRFGGVGPSLRIVIELLSKRGVRTGLRAIVTATAPSPLFQNRDATRAKNMLGNATYVHNKELFNAGVDGASGADPVFSILMTVHNASPRQIFAAIRSVRKQSYLGWELCICDDASTKFRTIRALEKASTMPGVKSLTSKARGGNSKSTNSLAKIAKGGHLVLLGEGDRLAAGALRVWAMTLKVNPHSRFLYSDEIIISRLGRRVGHHYKSDPNWELSWGYNYFGNSLCIQKELFCNLGGFRSEFAGAEVYEFSLRVFDLLNSAEVRHVPLALYERRLQAQLKSPKTSLGPSRKNVGLGVLQARVERLEIDGKVEALQDQDHLYRLVLELPNNLPLVSVIIPTRNMQSMLEQAVDSVLQFCDYSNVEVIIIDNGSDDKKTLAYLSEIDKLENVVVIRDESPFNYSALNNRAVAAASGEYILLLNNDIKAMHVDWLTNMMRHAQCKNVGAVGAKLFFSNGVIQHGGVVLGSNGPEHFHKFFPGESTGYANRLLVAQELSAVTGACLLVRKSDFVGVGGLDEELPVTYNDIDLCMKLRATGLRVVWTPDARLFHFESMSRGYDSNPQQIKRSASEKNLMVKKWGEALIQDPFYNVNLR